jgi:galactitol PTS system EIIB component
MSISGSAGKVYRIVVSCGTAIATSTHVAIKVKELLKERGIEVMTTQCRVVEIPSYAPDADLVISTAQVPFKIDVPVVDGIPFLTGLGVKEVVDKIEAILKQS